MLSDNARAQPAHVTDFASPPREITICVHHRASVNQLQPELKRLAVEAMEEDDKRRKGKKRAE